MKYHNIRKITALFSAALLMTSIVLSGCSSENTDTSDSQTQEKSQQEESDAQEESGEDADSESSVASDSDLITPVEDIDLEDQFTERDLDSSWEDRDPVYVTLETSSAFADDESNLSIDGTTITITGEGVFVFTGELSYGQIVVDAGDEDKVQIVLNGVTITNNEGACILVKNADKCFLTMESETENTLADTGSEYVQPEDMEKTVDAVVFADCDLTINGSGSLTVNAGYDNGIVSKEDLKITAGMLTITSTGKGIEVNDSIRIAGGVIIIDADDDAINTDNEEEAGKGYVYIQDGTFTLSAGDDGIHAATALLITGGTINIEESYEGLEGDTIDITGGSITIYASDDGMNASTGNQEMGGMGGMGGGMGGGGGHSGNGGGGGQSPSGSSGGEGGGAAGEQLSSGEIEASYMQLTMNVSDTAGGDFSPSGEGSMEPSGGGEGAQPGSSQESPGESFAGDENQDAGGMQGDAPSDEAEPSMEDGGDPAGEEMDRDDGGSSESESDEETSAYIRISGGIIYINASGDGIDSNGNIYVDGGTTYVDGPTTSADGAIDYGDGNFEAIITGGTVIAVGSAGMAENFTKSSTQYSIMYNFDSSVEAGTTLTITDSDGNEIISYTPSKTFRSVVVSTPDLSTGDYTFTAGDQSETVTVSDIISSFGSSGMGGGGSGGMGGGGSRGERSSSSADASSEPSGGSGADGQEPGSGGGGDTAPSGSDPGSGGAPGGDGQAPDQS